LAKAIDYGDSEFGIQCAMVDQARRFPKKEDRPSFLLWNGVQVKTSDSIPVPEHGIVRAAILSALPDVEQGFDLKLDDGSLTLAEGERVPHLRTWRDEKYEDTVRYPFFSRDGLLSFWNVSKRLWPDGSVTVEKWTGNSGFWIEQPEEGRRVYHCSPAAAEPPDFESLFVLLVVEKHETRFRIRR
jgi:hypothetical protein